MADAADDAGLAENAGLDGEEGGVKRKVIPVDQSLQLMDELLAKLMILNYEEEFCVRQEVVPFSPGYFACPAPNVAVQFQHFIELASYLAQSAGRAFKTDRYDDPNSSINRLVLELNGAGFVADFPASKLRQAHGEPVCRVLNFLSDLALQARHFGWSRPVYPAESTAEEADVDNAADTAADEIEDHSKTRGGAAAGGIDDDDEGTEEVLFSEVRRSAPVPSAAATSGVGAAGRGGGALGGLLGAVGGALGALSGAAAAAAAAGAAAAAAGGAGAGRDLDSSAFHAIEATVDPAAWKTEVERVAMRLRSVAPQSGKEWRAHLEQTLVHRESMASLAPDLSNSLQRIEVDAAAMLERVTAKEKFLNTTFRHLSEEYRAAQTRMEELSGEQQRVQQLVSSLSSNHTNVVEALEEIKSQMDDRGSSMTDTSPMVRIKEALAKLRREMKAMDLRIGVVGHTIMQSKLHRGKPGGGIGGVGGASSPGGGGGGGGDESGEFEISDDDADEDSKKAESRRRPAAASAGGRRGK